MRDYGVVSPMFWIGKTGRALRKYPDAQRVAIYFMTAPSSEMTGVFYCPLASILNDVGLFEAPSKPLTSPSQGGVSSYDSPLEGVKSAIVKLMELGFCVYDFESEFVFVTEMARWQIGESLKEKDNRIVGVKKSVKSMPKPLASLFLARYNEVFCLGYNLEDFQVNESPFEAPYKPLRSQEQEQEQEQDINTNKQHTQVCNEGSAVEDGVCSGCFDESSFDPDEVIDAPIKVQAAQAQLEHFDSVADDQPLSLAQLITGCKQLGIKLGHTPKTEAIASRETITKEVLRECAKAWKGTNTGTGYFVGILENASKDVSAVMPREKQEIGPDTITDKQASFFASRLVRDSRFCSKFGKGFQDYNVFASKVAANIRNPRHFEEYKPYMERLGLLGGEQ